MRKLSLLLLTFSLMSSCAETANATICTIKHPPGHPELNCRSSCVKHNFDKLNGWPKGRPGWVVDHICALANGGLDIAGIEGMSGNMQYQTPTASYLKDKIENTPKGKALFCTPENSLPKRTVFNCK
jgi:hypothetical protein